MLPLPVSSLPGFVQHHGQSDCLDLDPSPGSPWMCSIRNIRILAARGTPLLVQANQQARPLLQPCLPRRRKTTWVLPSARAKSIHFPIAAFTLFLSPIKAFIFFLFLFLFFSTTTVHFSASSSIRHARQPAPCQRGRSTSMKTDQPFALSGLLAELHVALSPHQYLCAEFP